MTKPYNYATLYWFKLKTMTDNYYKTERVKERRTSSNKKKSKSDEKNPMIGEKLERKESMRGCDLEFKQRN